MNDMPDTRSNAIAEALAAAPGGVLEQIAESCGATMREMFEHLPAGQALSAPASVFAQIWADLTSWGTIMFIVHTADGVFETKGAIPPGEEGRGYFNIHGESPIGGHIKASRCAAIYFIDRPFFGRRSCSVQFVNQEGGVMFKVFVGRDETREMRPEQLEKFEALRGLVGIDRSLSRTV